MAGSSTLHAADGTGSTEPLSSAPHAAQATTGSLSPQESPHIAPTESIDRDCLQAAYGHVAAALSLFDDAIVRESMAQPYPLEPHRPTPQGGEHPGRVRSYPLLGAVYGQSKAEVQARLQTVHFMGQRVSLAPAAAEAFRRVAQRLQNLVQEQPQRKSFILPVSGFTWRTIAGETRLSPHSFGIAVDLNPAKGPYWLWTAPVNRASQSAVARASYPKDIVAAFEAEGFIWGGKWHEYDMMHFEYRPELICKSKARQHITLTPAPAPEIGMP